LKESIPLYKYQEGGRIPQEREFFKEREYDAAKKKITKGLTKKDDRLLGGTPAFSEARNSARERRGASANFRPKKIPVKTSSGEKKDAQCQRRPGKESKLSTISGGAGKNYQRRSVEERASEGFEQRRLTRLKVTKKKCTGRKAREKSRSKGPKKSERRGQVLTEKSQKRENRRVLSGRT